MTCYQSVVRSFRVVLRPYGFNRLDCAEVSLNNCHRADTRLVGPSQDRSNQGNTDEVGSCWLIRVGAWGEAVQKKECDHATSQCSGASSGVCRDLLLALHADDPASGFARRAGPGCARRAIAVMKTRREARSVED